MPRSSHAVREEDILSTLAETDHAYTILLESGDNPALDRAGYAARMMLERFRTVLRRPDLRLDQLEQLLRTAQQEIQEVAGPRPQRVPPPINRPSADETGWAVMMTSIVLRRSNGNDH